MTALTPTKVEELSFFYSDNSFKLIRPSEYACINTSSTSFVGVKWVCQGIGLTDDQAKNERKKIGKDLVLSKGGSNLTLLTNVGEQDVLCIELDYLPLNALAT